ncbi:putative C6 transcription factor [Aspergillus clavatus NRRL 1]|uniref:C6 transcription factor, putative n=1 Tax=Aspergillus clavatus (strain ATCC 1007 / CBS 513.65 / DSM 816 / NCTC 3887 / NRRL 1 / QM 1276 / 107) TaxID=344612 RepID=A1C8V6_ASPCL|nr:C6 transcription factor, putative [Aspergillus clavatus NRRL 1]EAW13743.1 C6 transcription factor, putative [Aspergillus clavatus NRRL 1]
MESTTKTSSSNACADCRSQKRKCDKTLPSCSRCINFQPIQPYWNNITSRQLDVDRYYVGLAMTALADQSVSLDTILSEYFCHIHPWLPVIIERSFRNRLSQLHSSPCADIAMLLLAVSLVVGMKAQNGHQANIYQITKYLFAYLQLLREPSLQLVQGGLLLTLYELGSSLVQEASVSIGNCARLGYIQRLDLDDGVNHHDFTRFSESEERRRVWCGLYMLDRLIYQVATGFIAPHAVVEPRDTFRIPVDDSLLSTWSSTPEYPPSFSTPAEIPLCYFAREIQGVRILGPVQMLRQSSDIDWSSEKFSMLDRTLMYFMNKLIAQTPGSWAVLCGANAIGLASGIMLHQDRLSRGSRGLVSSEEAKASYLALSSFVKMVSDICFKFDAMEATKKIPWVPLPAVMCVGEAAIAVKYLTPIFEGCFQLDSEPFRRVLSYATKTWKLAGE